MARKAKKSGESADKSVFDSSPLKASVGRYLDWISIRNYARGTINHRKSQLLIFVGWCEERGLLRPGEVTRPILERYQRYLFRLRKPDGKPLSFRTQHSRLVTVRAFFKWLAREHFILYNPAAELELPKINTQLPRQILSQSELERVLNSCDLSDPLGVRDRAILETFYSTGMRRSELIKLEVFDLDRERQTVIIREGKGRRDRLLPIGERALAWIAKYREEVRPELIIDPLERQLFLTKLGKPFSPTRLTQIVKGYVLAADLGKSGSCHLFRHSMATLMLENGADIRYIQQLLGHVSLQTTEVYTQVSIQKLKEIYKQTHPGARLGRETKDEETSEPLNDDSKELEGGG